MSNLIRIALVSLLLWASMIVDCLAGMPQAKYIIREAAKGRLETISFFIAVFLLASWGVKGLWNYLAKDFTRLPRLTYLRALSIVLILGLLFMVVLTMISGARELMTPGAWKENGATYQLEKPVAE